MKWLNDEIFYPALNLHYLLRTASTNDLQLVLQKEGGEILDKMEAGLKRFDNEKSCHSPEILKEVRTLQKICNEKGAANGNISFLDGANHFLNSDLEGCGKRGIAIVTRLTTPPLFPEAGYFEKAVVKSNLELKPEQKLESEQKTEMEVSSPKKAKRRDSTSSKIDDLIIKLEPKKLSGKDLTNLIIKKFPNEHITYDMIRSRKTSLRKKGLL